MYIYIYMIYDITKTRGIGGGGYIIIKASPSNPHTNKIMQKKKTYTMNICFSPNNRNNSSSNKQ